MLPEHIVVLPLIVPGVRGALADTVTDNICAEEKPQELFAVTEISPPVAPAVAFIDVVVDVPVQPDGSTQV